MKWYEIEYAGGKTYTSIIGQSGLNLDEVLNTPDPPRFIKIENISYRSKLSEKYELYDKWDSKWENEMWINTSSIIAVRTIKDDLLTNPSQGEWNAFPEKIGFSILLSQQLATSMGETAYQDFRQAVETLMDEKGKQFTYMGKLKINPQELLAENEFIIVQFGNIVVHKKVEGEPAQAILQEVDHYLTRFTHNSDKEEGV